MTRPVLIGVGGSGQHVVHAYLRLLSLGFASADDVPHVFILDADAQLGERAGTKRCKLVDDIFALHSDLSRGSETPASLEILRPYRVGADGQTGALQLSQLLGIEGVDSIRPLAQAFLDDGEDGGNEWNVELTKGMMANPKVGSIALAHKADGGVGGEPQLSAEQFGALPSTLLPTTRVAVVGSNFGGTGSGVIPTLVRLLDRQNIDAVRAFMSLPWFTLDAGGATRDPSAARERDGVDPKARNASLGLHAYLGDLRGSGGAAGLRRSAFVLFQSMAGWPSEQRVDDGNFDQAENPHVLNLLQACAIQSFLSLGPAGAPNGKLYGAKTTELAEADGRFDQTRSPHLRLRLGPDDSRQLVDLARDAEATAFVLESCGRLLAEASEGKVRLAAERTELRPAVDAFAQLLGEDLGIGKVRHGPLGGLFNRRQFAADEVLRQLGTAMRARATWLRRSLLWLDRHRCSRAGPHAHKVSGVVGGESGHLFRDGETGEVPASEALQQAWQALSVAVPDLHGEPAAGASVQSQAYLLFLSLFERVKGMAADVDPLQTLSTAYRNEAAAASEVPLPQTAARVIGQAAHRRVRALRDGALVKQYREDSRQRSSDVPAGAGRPLLRFAAARGESANDVRLAEIDLDEQAVSDIDRRSTAHPLSLAYLDPYAGAVPGQGGSLDLSATGLREYGLRGIPNVAAPLLAQRWRLEKCRLADAAARRGSAYDNDESGRLRATVAGIHLQAQRVIEAAFWLLVSADPNVRFVGDLLATASRSTGFAQLLRRELELGTSRPLAAIVAAERSAHAGKPLFLWDGATWYLAGNSYARQFFAERLAQLPSVRRWYRSDNPLQRLPAPNAAAGRPLDAFFARELHGMVDLIDSEQRDRGSAAVALLRDVLQDIAEDAAARDTKARVNPAAHRDKGYLLWLRSAGNTAPLSVAPHRVFAWMDTLRCDHPVIGLRSDDQPNGLLPYRAQIWDLLEGGSDSNRLVLAPTGSKRVDAKSLGRWRVERAELQVAGLGKEPYDRPFGDEPLTVLQQELDWSLGVWPNFRADGWGYYVVSGMTRLGRDGRGSKRQEVDLDWLREGMKVELVIWGRRDTGRDARGELEVLGRISDGLPLRIQGRPEVVEITVAGMALGSRRIELRQVDGRAVLHQLGIDFGTSNTCMAIQDEDGNADSRRNVPLLPGGEFADGATPQLLLYMDASGDPNVHAVFLSRAVGFFHARNATVGKAHGHTIPSELFVSLDDDIGIAARQKPLLPGYYARGAQPLHEPADAVQPVEIGEFPVVSPLLTPLPPQPHGIDAEQLLGWLRGMVRFGDVRVFGDLKWPRGGDEEHARARGLRAIYLEHALVAALAVLRPRYAAFRNFVATLPEALSRVDNHFANSFGDDLRQVVQAVGGMTGMYSPPPEPAAAPVTLVSETLSALYMMGLHDAHSNASVLTIDIGGGTTDVGICLRYGRSGREQVRYTASAPFAGNRLLDAVAQLRDVRKKLGAANAGDDALTPLIKSQLRRSGRVSWSSERTEALAGMFFDAVYEYAFGLLHRFAAFHEGWTAQFEADPRQTLDVVLLGNGIKLYDALKASGSPNSLARYNERLRKRLVQCGLLTPAMAEAGRMNFSIPEMGKSGLILKGGLDAALEGSYRPEDHDVLLPAGLIAQTADGKRQVLERPQLVKLTEFREEWQGRGAGARGPAPRLSFDFYDERFLHSFPLTAVYWGDNPERDRRLQRVFQTGTQFSEHYRDPGALYLTGVAALENSDSFARLMMRHAAEAKA